MSYKKPQYKIVEQQTIQDLLKFRLVIPNENRRYEWSKNEWVIPVMDGIYSQMGQLEHHHMGLFIILDKDNLHIIYDAQHRVTTLILILIAIAEISSTDLRNEILDVISRNTGSRRTGEKCSEAEQAICKAYNWTRYPRLVSENENDFIVLGNLINTVGQACKSKKCTPYYISGSSEFTTKTEVKAYMKEHKIKESYDTRWRCNGCPIEFTDEGEMKDHLNKGIIVDSGINEAYEAVLKYIKDNKVPNQTLYEYLIDHVIFDKKVTTSEEEARLSYSQNNTIGKSVSASDLLKTSIVRRLPERKADIIGLFEWILSKNDAKSPIDTQQILYVCTNLITKKWVKYDIFKKGSYENMFDDIEKSEYDKVFNSFKELVEESMDLLKFMKEHRIGRLLSGLTSGCEIMMLCILPIGLKFKTGILDKYFKLLISASIRIDCNSKLTLNPLSYQGEIERILTNVLTDSMTESDCYKAFKDLLNEKIQSDENFHKNILGHEFKKNAYSKAILQFIVELTDTHEASLNSDCIDLEHIHAQSRAGELGQESLVHSLGNLTLFCAQNSADLKGNRSLKDKPFSEKILQYKNSNVKMTRKVEEDYGATGFSDKQILERTENLARLIHNETSKILNNS